MKVKGIKLSPGQAEVYTALKESGRKGWPDHILVPVVQHTGSKHQHSSGIRTRRRELERLGLVQEADRTVRTNSGREASVFRVVK